MQINNDKNIFEFCFSNYIYYSNSNYTSYIINDIKYQLKYF